MRLSSATGSELFAVNEIVVRLRSPRHEAGVRKVRRQLESAALRERVSWRAVWLLLGCLGALNLTVATYWWWR